jgi:hypothetical protein
MQSNAKFLLEEALKSRRYIELLFGCVSLRSLVKVNALLVTQAFKFSFSYEVPHNTLKASVNMYYTIFSKLHRMGDTKKLGPVL